MVYKYKKLRIAFYRQTTPYTCGAACLLMLLHHFDNTIPLSRELEMKIHKSSYYGRFAPLKYKTSYDFLSTTYSGLALFALKLGFEAKLYKEFDEFKHVNLWSKEEFDIMTRIFKKYENKALKKGLKICIGKFTLKDLIDNEIEKERPFMLLLPYFRNIFHNVIVRGYKSNEILVIDPSSGFSRRLIFHLEKDLEKIKFGRVALVIWK